MCIGYILYISLIAFNLTPDTYDRNKCSHSRFYSPAKFQRVINSSLELLNKESKQHDIEIIRSCHAGGSYFFMNNHNNEMQYMNYDIQIQITFFKYKMTLGLSINEKDQVLKSKLQAQYVQL